MKKKEYELRLGASLVDNERGALAVVGLRPDRDASGTVVLKPVQMPSSSVLPLGWSPQLKLDGRLLVSKGSSLAEYSDGMLMASENELPGKARCSLPLAANGLVMCEQGAALVEIDEGKPKVTVAAKDYPPISIYGVDDVELTVGVDRRTLSRSYSTGLFDKKDRESLVGDLSAAYLRLCADASASGVLLQPALARYRLLDASGNVLFESAPVLVSHSGGAQCCDSVALGSSDRTTVDAYNLKAGTYHVELALPSMADSGVAQAEILMTPLFHPYDPAGEGMAQLGRADSSSSVFARVGLPGRHRGLGTVYRNNARSIILKAISRIEMLEERVCVIQDPFGGEARSVVPEISCRVDPEDCTARIKAVFAKGVSPRAYKRVMLERPHRFSAAAVAECSGAVAWGNVRSLRYPGYPLATFASAVSSGSWRAVSAVYFKGDKGVVRKEEYAGLALVKLGPVLCYPAPDAREMTVVYYHEGRNHKQTFALSPEASGRFAVYVDPSMKPISLPECSPTVTVAATEESVEFSDTVAYARVGRPLDIIATADAGSEVVAIAGRSGSEQAWDFGRARFTIGCRHAIYSAGISLGSKATGLRTLLASGINRPDALAVGKDGEVYVAGNGISCLSRNGAVRRLSYSDEYVAVGYDGVRDELWALRREGKADVYCRRFDYGRFEYPSLSAEGFMHLGSLYLLAGRKIYDTAVEMPGAVDVRLRLIAKPSDRYGMVRAHRVHMAAQGSTIEGSLSVQGRSVTGLRPWLIRRAQLRGVLAGPVVMNLVSREVRSVEISLDARVSDDFVFDSFTLLYG